MLKKNPALFEIPLILAVLAVVGWYIYLPALRAPFVFDDLPQIIDNPHIRITGFSADIPERLLNCRGPNRFLAFATFALNYYFHQYNVADYRTVNVMIHIITACLVFILARLVLDTGGKRPVLVPFLAAALWLVNPVHIQSVTYITQRMNALAAMFSLLTLCCYIQARRLQINGKTGFKPVLFFVMAFFAGLCGLASKENAAILPVIILLYEWYFFQSLDRRWIKKRLAWIGIGSLMLVIIALIYMGGNPLDRLTGMYDKQDFTLGQRLLTEPRVVLYYLTLLLFPHPGRLNLDYNFPLSLSLFRPLPTLAALAALLALAVIAVYTARRHRLFSFALAWFLVTLAIESSFIGLALIFEHRTYLPSVFPAIAATAFLVKRLKPAPAGFLVLVAAIAVCGYATCQRNRVWDDEVRFWQDCDAKSPSKARILNNLGLAYKSINNISDACLAYEKALACDPDLINALNNLGTIYLENKDPGKALQLFEKAISIEPGFYDAHYNRGLALMEKGRVIEATRAFRNALEFNPYYEKAHNNLGVALMQQLELEQAIDHFQRALDLSPYFEKAFSNMGVACYKKGLTGRAIELFNHALDIDPYYLEAYHNMKRIKAQARKYRDSIIGFKKRLGRDPDNPRLNFNMAEIYNKAGMTMLAHEYYEKALKLKPDAADMLNIIGTFYVAHYQFAKAADIFERLSAQMPESGVVHYNLACLYALQDQPDKAVAALRTAIENGYNDWEKIASDKDLENINGTAYFRRTIINHYTGSGE